MELDSKRSSDDVSCVFISDFYKSDLNNKGGAENNDSVLLFSLRERGFIIEEVYSRDVSPTFIEQNKDKKFIISNFVGLSGESKRSLHDKYYIIYEHDHKYLKTRDPSKFLNFLAPEHQVVDREFYKNSQCVICLSKIQEQSVRNNLDISNVESIGCSLWSEKKLDFISSICETEKDKECCVVNSKNIVKGTQLAVDFCTREKYSFDLIESNNEKEFLETLASYERLIYIPTVLESLCRLVVEAKMLNCKVITKTKLLGAYSESWWSLNGKELISVIRQRQVEAIKVFEEWLSTPISQPIVRLSRQEMRHMVDVVEAIKEFDEISQSPSAEKSKSSTQDVTVILNCYRRPEYLEAQIKAIKEQTIKPKEIWLWVNYHEDNENIDFSRLGVDKVFRNDYNWKFYGRFAGALLARTEYIAMFDDDTIPGNRWLENCFSTMKTHEGVLGGAGVILKDDKYFGHDRYGWSSQNEETIEVDLVGHAWFFKTEWLQYLWKERPFTWENGEDIQFSYLAQKYGNIKTYCPPHPPSDRSLHSSLKGYELGVDSKATSATRNHSVFYTQRNACVKNAIDNGWKTRRG